MPHTVVIAPGGKVVFRKDGPIDPLDRSPRDRRPDRPYVREQNAGEEIARRGEVMVKGVYPAIDRVTSWDHLTPIHHIKSYPGRVCDRGSVNAGSFVRREVEPSRRL
ncbi:MAG: hypothetical protein QM811_08615 [Pirellulales bacterium]